MCFASLRLPPGHGTSGLDIAVSSILALVALCSINGSASRAFNLYRTNGTDFRQ